MKHNRHAARVMQIRGYILVDPNQKYQVTGKPNLYDTIYHSKETAEKNAWVARLVPVPCVLEYELPDNLILGEGVL